MWNKDEARGKADRVKGSVKEAAGDLTDDERLKNEGTAEKITGRVEEGAGRVRHKVGDAMKDAGERIKR